MSWGYDATASLAPLNYNPAYSPAATNANLAYLGQQQQAALDPNTLYGAGGFGGMTDYYSQLAANQLSALTPYTFAQPQQMLDPSAGYGGMGNVFDTGTSPFQGYGAGGSPFGGGGFGGGGAAGADRFGNQFFSDAYYNSGGVGGGYGNPPGQPSSQGLLGYTPQQWPGSAYPGAQQTDYSGFGLPGGIYSGNFGSPGSSFDNRFGSGLGGYAGFGGMYGSPTDTSSYYGFGGAPGGGIRGGEFATEQDPWAGTAFARGGGGYSPGDPYQSAFGNVGQSPGMGLGYGGFGGGSAYNPGTFGGFGGFSNFGGGGGGYGGGAMNFDAGGGGGFQGAGVGADRFGNQFFSDAQRLGYGGGGNPLVSQRSGYADTIRNDPNKSLQLAARLYSEDQNNPATRQAILEAMLNRRFATGNDPLDPNYYPGNTAQYNDALAKLSGNNDLLNQIYQEMEGPFGGSNTSNYATDWASSTLANTMQGYATPTWTSPSNEQFFRKDFSTNTGSPYDTGPGIAAKNQRWYESLSSPFPR